MMTFLKLTAPCAALAFLAACGGSGTSSGGTTMAAAPTNALPAFSATCPGGVSVASDGNGSVAINGKRARLEQFSANFYEASSGGFAVSLSTDPDGTPSVSYNTTGGANGVCSVA